MKDRNTEKIELDEYTSGGFLTLDWLDEDKMDEKIYKSVSEAWSIIEKYQDRVSALEDELGVEVEMGDCYAGLYANVKYYNKNGDVSTLSVQI